MSNALKMTKLDFYTVKSQIPANIVSLLAITLLFEVMGASFGTLFFTAAWYAALSANTIFMTQEKNRLERMYVSLALDGNDFVRGRYLFYYAHYIATLFLVSVVDIVSAPITNRALYAQDFIGAACDSLLIFTVIVCVQIPVCMRLPYSKAKFWYIMIFIAIVAAFMGFSTRIFPEWMWDTNTVSGSGLMSAVCVAASVVVVFVSYAVAKWCYRRRRRTA